MNLEDLIVDTAEYYGLDPKLVACIIYQESGGDPDAYRFEDEWYDRHMRPRKRKDLIGFVPMGIPTLASEKRARSASWGLMQVMGNTARLIGYKGRWLPALQRPEVNLDIGCKYLAYLFARAGALAAGPEGSTERLNWVLYHWNGSREYPPLIHQHMRDERWRKILKQEM